MRLGVVVLCAFLAAAPDGASAQEWEVDDDASRIEFVVVVNGYPNRGVFPEFEGDGVFDASSPETSALEIVIDMGKLDMGNPVATSIARSVDWFDSEAHPEAVFRLHKVAPDAAGAYLAEGSLTVRGVERAVSAPLEMTLDERIARAKGEAVIDRHEFGIGSGPSTLIMEVEPEIRVRFDLTARAAP